MRHPLLLTLSLCICGMSLLAQTPSGAGDALPNAKVEFELKIPEVRKKDSAHRIPRVTGSLYNKIEFLDSRPLPVIGPTFAGLIKNHPADLILKQPVDVQLTAILNGLIDSTAGNGELLFQLRRFNYIEEYSTRYCFLKATLYSKTSGRYQQLMTLDTVLLIQVGGMLANMNVQVRPAVVHFIRRALREQPMDTMVYNEYALQKMDSIEMSRLPLFRDTAWVDGMYMSYSSFSRQLPDRQCTVKMGKSGQIKSIKVLDASGTQVEPRWQDMYAVVYQGQAYIVTEYGFYPVTRTDNALLFTGDIKVPPADGDLAGAEFMIGRIGIWVASKGYRTTYTMSIDPLNGEFVHLRLIPPPPPNF